MNKDEREYYGIRFNGKVPKKHKVNEFSKEVEITFLGQAYLVEKKDDDKVEKIKIDNYYKLKKEGKYEIEFVDKQNFIYNLQIEIHKPFLFFIIIFLIGLLLLGLLLRPTKMGQSPMQKFFRVLDFSVLDLEIIESEEPIINYVFEVGFDNIVSKDMDLSNSINAKSIAKNKIAPGVSGEFSIIISTKESNVDMTYSVDFQDITNDKPNNLLFKIRGQNKEFNSLQQLENYLKGTIKKDTQKEIIIDWRWPYEIDNEQDTIDTDNGTKLQNYKFKINVLGEEVI